jgi:hypothetical protein
MTMIAYLGAVLRAGTKFTPVLFLAHGDQSQDGKGYAGAYPHCFFGLLAAAVARRVHQQQQSTASSTHDGRRT